MVMPHSMAVPHDLTVALGAVPVAEVEQPAVTATGRYRVEPATSSLQSMLPPRARVRRDCRVLARRRRRGPGDAEERRERPGVPAVGGGGPARAVDLPQQPRRIGPGQAEPLRDRRAVATLGATVQPQAPGVSATIRTASMSPGRAPRTATGRYRQCPRKSPANILGWPASPGNRGAPGDRRRPASAPRSCHRDHGDGRLVRG